MIVESAAPFEAVFTSGVSGQTGTVEVAVIDNDGVVVIGPTTVNIAEAIIDGVPTGLYTWNCPAAPAALGQYTIAWSIDGLWDPEDLSTPDELVVVAAGAADGIPIPPPAGGGPVFGPCSAWTTVEAVNACCTALDDPSVYQDAVDEASQVLFELSGRLFVGLCEKTVRPCSSRVMCGVQVLSRGHLVGWNDFGWDGDISCGCTPLDRVLLSGYPVREITQVKIDGDVVNPATYRLDGMRYLVRTNGYHWPSCQALDLPDTDDGTFSVTYTYGQSPPLIGSHAAAQLACEIYKACAGSDCALPTGTTRVARQGVVIERLAFSAWGLQNGIWRTGLNLVDAFLNGVNRSHLIRRPTVWSPARHMQYARREGF